MMKRKMFSKCQIQNKLWTMMASQRSNKSTISSRSMIFFTTEQISKALMVRYQQFKESLVILKLLDQFKKETKLQFVKSPWNLSQTQVKVALFLIQTLMHRWIVQLKIQIHLGNKPRQETVLIYRQLKHQEKPPYSQQLILKLGVNRLSYSKEKQSQKNQI